MVNRDLLDLFYVPPNQCYSFWYIFSRKTIIVVSCQHYYALVNASEWLNISFFFFLFCLQYIWMVFPSLSSSPTPPLFPFRKEQASHGYQLNMAEQDTISLGIYPYTHAGRGNPVGGKGSQA